MKVGHKWYSPLIAIGLIVAVLIVPAISPLLESHAHSATTELVSAIVTRVIDGDTIEVEIDGEEYRVRYIGIDTPERGEPYYEEARGANQKLVGGQEVRLERDVTDRDKYDRLLRYVYVDGIFVNLELVRLGYARVYPKHKYPDNKYYEVLKEAETEAKRAGRGLWATEPTEVEQQLYQGVNFVSYKGATMPVADALASLPPGALVSTWHHDNPSKQWAVYLPDAPPYASDLQEVVYLQPYVIIVRQDCIWRTQPPEAADVQITDIFYDGIIPRVESDEYVQITNLGNRSQDLHGWVLMDISEGYPSFAFPSYILASGESIRVYTNEIHPEYGGFSFGYGQAIWNNTDPDEAGLYDADGRLISRRSY